MEQLTMEQEIVRQMLDVMEKSGMESIAPVLSPADQKESADFIETILINLKTLNAKYDKNEAIQQIRCLLDKYNIQIDQLLDKRGIA
jgi:hypothetical protein